MAKVIFMNGILSGKLGGLVYAFNKAGNYVRTFRKGTNPATSAQLVNRALFASAVSSFHAMTGVQKAAWNSFAVTFFKPKFGSSGVRFSGYNAFVSLNNVVNNMNLKGAIGTISAPPAVTFTSSSFINTSIPPHYGMAGTIKDSDGEIIGITLKSVLYSEATNIFSATFRFSKPIATGSTSNAPNFSDSIALEPVGFALVGSLPITQPEQFIENPDINLLAIIKPIGQTDDWTTAQEITINCAAVPEMKTRKFGYSLGDLFQVKAYMISAKGQTQPLNAVFTRVTNAAP